MFAIETKNLSKHFGGVYAVDRLSVSVGKGAITSIVGPNGSGKTTLTHLLSGVLPWDEGTVIFGGKELKRLAPHAGRELGVARTFQHVRLFEQMSVYENLTLVLAKRTVLASIFEQKGSGLQDRAKELLLRVGLWEKRDAPAGELSYGQRKLLEVARVLGARARIILFDEPFAGLFPGMVEMLCDVMREMRGSGCSVVLIEHNMKIIRELSDEVFVMDAGKLLACGKPAEVLARKDVREAYLGV
ncbi:ABC transporter ATP-binding protein [Candidatus Uhrbacteria bacterium]|nr:ABC transporter ATP-binding protein [Candidatus Uhrbacteria bacterium]